MLRTTIAVLTLLSLSGCKHLQKKKDNSPILLPPNGEVKEEPKQKVVNITILRVENFTIKAF